MLTVNLKKIQLLLFYSIDIILSLMCNSFTLVYLDILQELFLLSPVFQAKDFYQILVVLVVSLSGLLYRDQHLCQLNGWNGSS